ncbi:MAG: hypothetical protein KAU26_05650 [Methylococcales bacterium]|nr:hypothetical protein [Methylococcales bacterium]
MSVYRQKDALKTKEGLYFSVIKDGLEAGKVLGCFRYRFQKNSWKKYNTEAGNQFLQQYYPQYLYYSAPIDAHVHAVSVEDIQEHYRPSKTLQTLLSSTTNDPVIKDLMLLCQFFEQKGLETNKIGVTGSLLIGAQNSNSDIDLVFYQRDCFHQARHITAHLIHEHKCQPLTEKNWQESFIRRDCALNFEEYQWHEQRKGNKLLIKGRKVDLTLSLPTPKNSITRTYSKQGGITLRAKITDDHFSFDTPAQFSIDHPVIKTVLCFSATYTGQAFVGELVEISGQLECSTEGHQQIIIGSSREAKGEYIRVIG